MNGVKRIILTYAFTFIFYVVLAVFWVFHTQNDSEYYRMTLLPMIVVAPMFWILVSIGSLCRHIFWRVNGYNNMPIFIYPFVFTKLDRWKCTLVFDPTGLWAVAAPPHFLEKIGSDNINKNLSYTVEKVVSILEIIIMLVAMAITILLKDWFFLNAEMICLLYFIVTAFINEDFMHGQMTKMRAIKHGSIFHYAMNSAIIYEGKAETLETHWLQLTLDDSEKAKFNLLDLISWKYLLLLACAQQHLLDHELTNYIEKEVLGGNYMGKLFYTGEYVEIMKLYMYYGIIIEDETKITFATQKLYEFKESEMYPMGDGLKSTFDGYLDIGKYRRIYDFDMNGKEVLILKKDYPYCKFEKYNKSKQMLVKLLQEKCVKKSRKR